MSPTNLLHNEGLSLPRVGGLRLRPLRGQPRHEVRVGGQLGVDQVELLAGLRFSSESNIRKLFDMADYKL